MKTLSDTLKELNINFSFPIKIKDVDGNTTYYEDSNGYWSKREYDVDSNQTYYEDSDGTKRGTPRSVKTCEGKIVEIDGVKYELKAL